MVRPGGGFPGNRKPPLGPALIKAGIDVYSSSEVTNHAPFERNRLNETEKTPELRFLSSQETHQSSPLIQRPKHHKRFELNKLT